MSGSLRPYFVLFGSSIVQYSFFAEGWGAILSHLYARKDARVQPSLVIVCFGGNDSSTKHSSGLGPHVPLEEYVENVRKIVNHLKSLSENTRILFLGVPPINDAVIAINSDGQPSRTNESCRIYSEACLKVCSEMNIKAIDLWSAIQTVDNWQDVCFIDGIHFTAEGSKITWREILKVLKEAEWEPSLHWSSMPSEFGEDSPYDPVAADGNSTQNLSNLAYPHEDFWL
ncbi:GDSL esterase/lipase CPRD49, partial [Mucuna pruriens]